MLFHRPIFILRAIHKNLFLKMFCSIFLSAFLGIAMPAHRHSDGVIHGDCIFCITQKQAPTAVMTFSLPLITGSIVELSQLPARLYYPHIIAAFQSRAPPVSTLS